jgi:hypothetical protein
LTQKLYETKYGSYGVPAGGIEPARQALKQDIAQEKASLVEEEAYKEFTEPEPFSKDYRADLGQPDVSDVADSTATVSKQPNASNPWYGIPTSDSSKMTNKSEAEAYWRGEWKVPVQAQTQQTSPQPSTSAQQSFAEWTKGKNDALGYNWQGYKPITGAEYATPEQRARWKNVQKVGGSLYGYYK